MNKTVIIRFKQTLPSDKKIRDYSESIQNTLIFQTERLRPLDDFITVLTIVFYNRLTRRKAENKKGYSMKYSFRPTKKSISKEEREK